MWRITNDFWDDWALLKNMFTRCEIWQSHVGPGCWPDCDMLPLGRIGVKFGQPRQTRFTPAEQKTMLTLWSVFRSPLILGAELPSLDEATLRLLTNRDVLRLNRHSFGARQIAGTTLRPSGSVRTRTARITRRCSIFPKRRGRFRWICGSWKAKPSTPGAVDGLKPSPAPADALLHNRTPRRKAVPLPYSLSHK